MTVPDTAVWTVALALAGWVVRVERTLTSFQEQNKQFDVLNKRFDNVDQKFNKFDERQEELIDYLLRGLSGSKQTNGRVEP